MARCPDCNKFVSIDSEQDPEVNLDASETGVTGDVQIANACADCGTELRTATLDVNVDAENLQNEDGVTLATWYEGLTEAAKETAQFEVEETETERTSRSEGKGRSTHTFYGATVQFDVTVTFEVPVADTDSDDVEEKRMIFSGTFSDDVQASSMDEV